MLQRLAALLTALGGMGSAPVAVRVALAVAGIVTLGVTVVIFARHAWDATLDDTLMAWTGLFIALGLAMVWTAGRK